MLYIVNKSPFAGQALQSCLLHVRDGVAVLLIEDAVYGVAKGTKLEAVSEAVAGGTKLYALGPDLVARGMLDNHIMEAVQIVDYEGFVDLVAEHEGVQTWL